MAPYFSAYQTFTVDPTSGTVSQTVLVEEYASGNCGSIPGCPNATHYTGTAKYCYNLPHVNKTVYDYSVNNWCMLATTTGANYDGKYVWDMWAIYSLSNWGLQSGCVRLAEGTPWVCTLGVATYQLGPQPKYPCTYNP